MSIPALVLRLRAWPRPAKEILVATLIGLIAVLLLCNEESTAPLFIYVNF